MQKFRHCPSCGAALATQANPLHCLVCSFRFFFNPTVAAGAFISNPNGELLFIRRAKDPAKGMLGLPGGFVDIILPFHCVHTQSVASLLISSSLSFFLFLPEDENGQTKAERGLGLTQVKGEGSQRGI